MRSPRGTVDNKPWRGVNGIADVLFSVTRQMRDVQSYVDAQCAPGRTADVAAVPASGITG